MTGCDYMNRSFTVPIRDDRGKDFCSCGKEITGLIRKYNGEKLCQDCFNRLCMDKEGLCTSIQTSDTFGKGNAFIHTNEDGTKQEITSRKQWEKAGYKDALDCIKVPRVKNMVKEKMKQLKRKGMKARL